ncbi:uncharacterized protein EAE97_011847 [Botrytis byssoidea]|uniref:Uncharacterized protein n=1 Tax=Botrytis byssoidea TaxID=139641 RepID=A0A9P5HVA9_9HELO|nr:uncharacterized protein EAE97_011847 [Botrytis byssoidea]KAF7918752.1 hypothetical protein EAE97_011847 [Botrytis byssoidea]
MRGIVMIRGQAYVQLLDEINIKDPEAIRRVVRQAVTLPPIDEFTRQGIKICVSGPVSSLLGTSTSNLTWIEQQAANDIQKLWKRGERYQVHMKRLIQDCDVTRADFLVAKGVESARKYCLRTQEVERQIGKNRSLVQSDANEYQDLSDKESGQRILQTQKDAYKQEEKNVMCDHGEERTTPNKRQKRKQSVVEQSPTRSISTESQDFENQESQENRNESTPINKPNTHRINNSKKQAVIEPDKRNNTSRTRMVNNLRDHNAVGVAKSRDEAQTQKSRKTRNSLRRSENNGVASNETVPPPELSPLQTNSSEVQNVRNALAKELADYNKRGGKEKSVPIGEKRQRQPVKQQPEPIFDSEDDTYTPKARTTPYKRKIGRGGARRGPAWEKLKTERENDACSSNHKSQGDQLGAESNPIGIEDSSDNETVVRGKLDNQEEDIEIEMEDLQ